MRYVWYAKYDTGNDTIDSQHRMIFDAANVFSDAIHTNKEAEIIDKAFDLLLQYTNTHFSDEEQYYEEIGSALLATQKIEHQELINELREIWYEKRHGSKEAGTDLDVWMERRLIPHIISEDTSAQKATG
ncbi:bacteriohemerythrin [Pseudomonadota bacterium]